MPEIIRDKKFYISSFLIMLPIAGQNVINISVNLFGMLMISSFGEMQISAMALANQFYFIFSILCMGIGSGTVVLTSQFWGRSDVDSINRSLSLMMKINLVTALLFTAATTLFPRQIMQIYSSEPEIIEYGARYLKYVTPVYFIHGAAITMTLVLRSVRAVKIGLVGSFAAFFINIFSNWIFIFGKFGAPRMEISGASFGTLIARIAEFLIIFGYVLFVDKKIRFKLRYVFMKLDSRIMKDFFIFGSPVILSDLLLALGNNALAMVMGRMGSVMVAANAVTNLVVQLSMVFNMGIAAAGAVVIGNTVGRGERVRAQSEGFTFLLLAVMLGLFSTGVLLIINPVVVSFYNLSPATLEVSNQLMLALAVTSVFQTVALVMTKGVLRGGGDTRFLMVADVLFLWAASVPLGYMAGLVWGFPVFWVSIFLRIDMIIKTVWCTYRLLSRKWIKEV